MGGSSVRFWKSLRFNVILVVLMIILPLLALLYFETTYSMDLVREQVMKSYDDLLPLYVQKMDDSLDEIESYLMSVVNYNEDFLYLNRYTDFESIEYLRNRQRAQNQMNNDINYYKTLSSLFMYSRSTGTLLLSVSSIPQYQSQFEGLYAYASRDEIESLGRSTPWQLIEIGGERQLVKCFVNEAGVLYGATVSIRALSSIEMISFIDQNLGMFILDMKGTPVVTHNIDAALISSGLAVDRSGFGILKEASNGQKVLVLSRKSNKTELTYAIAIDERLILLHLPFFQTMIYVMPGILIICMTLLVLILRRILFRPMNHLVQGMKSIGEGELQTRLDDSGTNEFRFLNQSFNTMAGQIRQLKIGVYEQTINAQKAELKHLQMQINPHFYANSLNILYNLAALKEYKAIQRLSLYLSNHFRFLIQSGEPLIHLSEELAFTENYLAIQKIRFEDRLAYRFDVPDDMQVLQIPPLSIQTLVENSIIHGFREGAVPLTVEVQVRRAPGNGCDRIEIIVQDDGRGYPTEFLEKFQSDAGSSGESDRHVGLWNLRSRLVLQYDGNASLELRNREDGGARARIALKAPR